jgi:hypothetical protein
MPLFQQERARIQQGSCGAPRVHTFAYKLATNNASWNGTHGATPEPLRAIIAQHTDLPQCIFSQWTTKSVFVFPRKLLFFSFFKKESLREKLSSQGAATRPWRNGMEPVAYPRHGGQQVSGTCICLFICSFLVLCFLVGSILSLLGNGPPSAVGSGIQGTPLPFTTLTAATCAGWMRSMKRSTKMVASWERGQRFVFFYLNMLRPHLSCTVSSCHCAPYWC